MNLRPPLSRLCGLRYYTTGAILGDPRLSQVDRELRDEFAVIREDYSKLAVSAIPHDPLTRPPRRKAKARCCSGAYTYAWQSGRGRARPLTTSQCHGLMGFDRLQLAGSWIPGIECELKQPVRRWVEAELTVLQIGAGYRIA